jgi:hypothetical protein
LVGVEAPVELFLFLPRHYVCLRTAIVSGPDRIQAEEKRLPVFVL